MGRLDDKAVLITGGAGGIGQKAAEMFIAEGAMVTITDISEEGPALAREIGADYISHDVTRPEQWDSVIAQVDKKHGKIDVLVNGAGIEGNLNQSAIDTITLEEWRRVHAINLDGTFLGCQKILPVMQRNKSGSILNISSMVSLFPTPMTVAYGSSKAAVQHLSKSVALFAARDGNQIRCNSVHPGLIRTRMFLTIAKELSGVNDATLAAEYAAKLMLPLGILGEPEDVGWLMVYLASDEARHVTGCEFCVDGGWGLNSGGMAQTVGRR